MDKREEVEKVVCDLVGAIDYARRWPQNIKKATDKICALFAAPTVGESSPGGDLPCPFCGAPASGDSCHPGFDLVRCSNDKTPHCPASFGCVQRKTWNLRAALSPSKAPVQMLCSVCKKEAVLTVCEDCQEKENHARDGGDATPGMDLREAVGQYFAAFDRWMDFFKPRSTEDADGLTKALDAARDNMRAILRKAPPKGDPAAPSLLAGGREAVARDEIAKQLVEHAGFAMAMGGSRAEPIAWDTMPEPAREVWRTHADRILAINKPSPQAGAQGDATGGGV